MVTVIWTVTRCVDTDLVDRIRIFFVNQDLVVRSDGGAKGKVLVLLAVVVTKTMGGTLMPYIIVSCIIRCSTDRTGVRD